MSAIKDQKKKIMESVVMEVERMIQQGQFRLVDKGSVSESVIF